MNCINSSIGIDIIDITTTNFQTFVRDVGVKLKVKLIMLHLLIIEFNIPYTKSKNSFGSILTFSDQIHLFKGNLIFSIYNYRYLITIFSNIYYLSLYFPARRIIC